MSNSSATGTSSGPALFQNQASVLTTQIITQVKQNIPISRASIINYAIEAMQLIENIPYLTGADKQSVLLSVINTIIENSSSLSAAEKTDLEALASTILPPVIAAICAAANGLLNINVSKWCTTKCF